MSAGQLSEPMVKRLEPVRCGRCNWPVGHMNKRVAGAEGGGLCTRCTKDERGKTISIYTFYGVIPADQEDSSIRS